MIVLVDLDDVIFDWSAKFDEELDALGEVTAAIPRKPGRVSFNLHHGLAPEHSAIIDKLMLLEKFYESLKPIEGAIDGLNRIAEKHEVRLVSSPWPGHATCASEKMVSVRHHLGDAWERRTFLVPDKTVIYGDAMIDDKDKITGLLPKPHWTRVVHDMPWNQETPGIRMHDWSEVDEILERVEFERAGLLV